MKSAEFVIIPRTDLPAVTLDGGVWHCDGRLFVPESMSVRELIDEANFWQALLQRKREEAELSWHCSCGAVMTGKPGDTSNWGKDHAPSPATPTSTGEEEKR